MRVRMMRLVLSFAVVITMIGQLVLPTYAYDMSSVLQYQTISAGPYHTAAVKSDGSLWTWGINWFGQLGDGTLEVRLSPIQVMENAVAVSVGEYHTAAIKKDNSLWLWGNNGSGELGDGTTKDRYLPIKIMDDVVAVSAGRGFTTAIKSDGSLWIWGSYIYGVLGIASDEDVHTPLKLMDDIVAVSAGDGYVMVIKNDKTLWGWGYNLRRQLGDASYENQNTPIKIADEASSVAVGRDFTMIIKTDGSLWGMGENSHGELSDASLEDGYFQDQRQPVKIMDSVKSVSIGQYHTACIKADDSLWSWGDNYFGQLGDNTTNDNTKPIKIMDGVTAVSAGWLNTMAITSDGYLWGWGENIGKIGNGEVEDVYTPVKIMNTFSAINAKFLAPIEPPDADSIPISNRTELEAISGNLSGKYHLVADIDLSDEEWVSIGDSSANSFSGVFDGQGFAVVGLKILDNGYDYNGLFGYANRAEIKNVSLEKIYINTVGYKSVFPVYQAYTGGLCAYSDNSYIYNCYSTGEISVTISVSTVYASGIVVGGICGNAYYSSVQDCYNTATVSVYASGNAAPIVGGVCGSNPAGSMYNCHNAGAILATSEAQTTAAGGVCGSGFTISNCSNKGSVVVSSLSVSSLSLVAVGGICAFGNTINVCYNTGKVSGVSEFSSYTGGICGSFSGYSINDCYNTGSVTASASIDNEYSEAYSGGICGVYYGDFTAGFIKNCYNIGKMTASASANTYCGGIFSYYAGGGNSVTNCYCLKLYDGDYGTELTAEQMKSVASFVGFDFDSVWDMTTNANDGYPHLRNMPVITLPLNPVTDISLSSYNITFDDASSAIQRIDCDLIPTAATNKAVSVASSNNNVVKARVDFLLSGGSKQIILVEPIGIGTATITVKCEGIIKQIGVTVGQRQYSSEADVLRKIALSKFVYNNLTPYVGRNISKIPESATSKKPMFNAYGTLVKWEEFFEKTIYKHKLIDICATHNVYGSEIGFYGAAFEDENGDIIIAYRGTEDMSDWVSGGGYTILNLFSKQFDFALDYYNQVKSRYPGKKIMLTGHSLGGALAAYVSMVEKDVKADCFNDATGWIIWNTYIENMKDSLNIKQFDGIDLQNYTSYVNIDESFELAPSTPLHLSSNFNVYTAKHKLDYRNRFELPANSYENPKGMHGLESIITYDDGIFGLTGSVDPSAKISVSKTKHINDPFNANVVLMKSNSQRGSSTGTGGSIFMAGEGTATVTGAGLGFNDRFVAITDGNFTLCGKGGSDTYYVDLTRANVTVSDPSGFDDVVVIRGASLSEIDISEDTKHYIYTHANTGKSVRIVKDRDWFQPNVTVQLEDGTPLERSLRTVPFSSQDYSLKSLSLTGAVSVSVYDGENNLLGVHGNTDEVETTQYGYFYPSDGKLDIDLINGDYILEITGNGQIGCAIYDSDMMLCFENNSIDLSDATLIINSSNSGFATVQNGVQTPLETIQRTNAEQVLIDAEEINITAGTTMTVSAQVLPDNAINSEVTWEIVNNSEKAVAVVETENGVAKVTGISDGSATLWATATSGISCEIPITVTQDPAPQMTAYDYVPYSSADSIEIFAQMPEGYDTMFIDGIESQTVNVTGEGTTIVKAIATNSATGARTKTAQMEIKLDRTAPLLTGAETGNVYSIDRLIEVRDENIDVVTTNGVPWTEDELILGKWHSDTGEFTVVATDFSGKETKIEFEIAPLPAISEITEDSIDDIVALRQEFENIKDALPLWRSTQLEEEILARQRQWIILTGQWFLDDIEFDSGTATVKAFNRLNDYSQMATLTLAVYDNNSRLLTLKIASVENSTDDYSINVSKFPSAKLVKAFLWNGLASLLPLADSTAR